MPVRGPPVADLLSGRRSWTGTADAPAEVPGPPVRATERQRGSGQTRPAWPGNALMACVAGNSRRWEPAVAVGEDAVGLLRDPSADRVRVHRPAVLRPSTPDRRSATSARRRPRGRSGAASRRWRRRAAARRPRGDRRARRRSRPTRSSTGCRGAVLASWPAARTSRRRPCRGAGGRGCAPASVRRPRRTAVVAGTATR